MSNTIVTSTGTFPSPAATVTPKLVELPETAVVLSTAKTRNTGLLFNITGNSKGVVLRNPKSTLVADESLHIEKTKIANAYQGSKIDPTYVYPSRSGSRLYLKLNENVEASQDGSVSVSSVSLPFSMSLAITVPDALLDANQQAKVVTEMSTRLLSYLYPKGTSDLSRLTEIIVGKLLP